MKNESETEKTRYIITYRSRYTFVLAQNTDTMAAHRIHLRADASCVRFACVFGACVRVETVEQLAHLWHLWRVSSTREPALREWGSSSRASLSGLWTAHTTCNALCQKSELDPLATADLLVSSSIFFFI